MVSNAHHVSSSSFCLIPPSGRAIGETLAANKDPHERDALEKDMRCYVAGVKGHEHLDQHPLGESAAKLLNLMRLWVTTILPHVLGKRNRVEYGLLPTAKWHEYDKRGDARLPGPPKFAKTMGRKLLAVPFVGKDMPSDAAEFSSPDVIVGFTLLAYRYEGLRELDIEVLLCTPRLKTRSQDLTKDEHVAQKGLDFRDNVSRFVGLQDTMKKQTGPFEERAAWLLYDAWYKLGRLAMVDDVASAADDDGAAAGCGGGGGGASGDAQLPLDLLNMGLEAHRTTVRRALKRTAPAILFYLRSYVFPRAITYHRLKLQASGMDIGSDTLFATRLGFSGTPSNLLPPSLWPCKFQEGTQATVLRTLMDPAVVGLKRLRGAWTPREVLVLVARGGYRALIDTAALITGLSNHDVAKFVLHYRKAPSAAAGGGESYDVAVYLDEHNHQVGGWVGGCGDTRDGLRLGASRLWLLRSATFE